MQAAVRNEATLTTHSRLFIGFATAWLSNWTPLLINEIAHPKQRSGANTLFMLCWYSRGHCYAVFHYHHHLHQHFR
ncbi:hypothetical protein CGRA01v4_05211 [Colletotrichum graminicola]|uniref:Uncharacterized protein n=1 Tax=Colletotrichum graminicola (strain M1.001 / M2 / FGSC 10212) TaxID=645133 RepID=E3QEX6_COLGM|nr:uncharacterized protein GLRG_04576 [Colletotrichum graminicola M1.001]EFQ29432.1 hypothetical protein GLRG_04576 [Colletotrichum graminicola M1.001]WDK13930.1 hypothetical protein CGRA01v4_05211 [Colletotrichum graminicola]